MKTYKVTLSADAIVSVEIRIKANSPEEAQAKALAMSEDELDSRWEFGMLHDAINECAAIVRYNGKEIKVGE